MPRLFLLGGSGRTGSYIIDYALSKGHTLTALVPDPAKLTPRAGLTAVQGAPMNRSDVDGAIDGADAVIVALNSTRHADTPWAKPVSPPRLMADSVADATAAMTARGIRRIVVVSAFGVGDSLSRQPLPIRWMTTRTNLSYTYADHNLVDTEIRDTDTDWTLLRPVAFNKKRSAGKIDVTDIQGPKPSFFISRPAVAHFAVDVIDAGSHIREAPIISRNHN
jgi:putative NADH-flavin reductase